MLENKNYQVVLSVSKRWRFVSWFIKFVTRGKVSHSSLKYYDEDFQVEMNLEADQYGLHQTPWQRWLETNEALVIVTPRIPIGPGVREVALKFLGGGYDYAGAAGVFLSRVLRWFRIKWRNSFASSKSVFCSEAIALSLQACNYPGADKLDPSLTTPEDLREFFLADRDGALTVISTGEQPPAVDKA